MTIVLTSTLFVLFWLGLHLAHIKARDIFDGAGILVLVLGYSVTLLFALFSKPSLIFSSKMLALAYVLFLVSEVIWFARASDFGTAMYVLTLGGWIIGFMSFLAPAILGLATFYVIEYVRSLP